MLSPSASENSTTQAEMSETCEEKVSEEDIHRIEQATNDLLADLQAAYGTTPSLRLNPREWH